MLRFNDSWKLLLVDKTRAPQVYARNKDKPVRRISEDRKSKLHFKTIAIVKSIV